MTNDLLTNNYGIIYENNQYISTKDGKPVKVIKGIYENGKWIYEDNKMPIEGRTVICKNNIFIYEDTKTRVHAYEIIYEDGKWVYKNDKSEYVYSGGDKAVKYLPIPNKKELSKIKKRNESSEKKEDMHIKKWIEVPAILIQNRR